MEVSLAILAVLGILSLTAVLVVVNGFVLSVLWGWFVVPLFGLPPLAIAGAIGLSVLVSLVVPYSAGADSKLSKAAAVAISRPLVALAIGWIVHQWI